PARRAGATRRTTRTPTPTTTRTATTTSPPQPQRGREAVSTDPLAQLLALREKESRLVIGLLSGTSADGTDAALCEIGGSGESTELHVLASAPVRFSRAVRERIFRLGQADNAELADVDVLLGEAFAD